VLNTADRKKHGHDEGAVHLITLWSAAIASITWAAIIGC
jgi:hypothetical protein